MYALQGRSQIINHDETLSVSRNGPVVFIDGLAVSKKIEEFPVVCNVQPVDAKDLLLVPEGDRTKEQFWMYYESTVSLQLRDVVTRTGKKYQVQAISQWGSYERTRIMLIDIGPERQQ